jgi:predicted Na+-dependent transporter
LTAFLTWVGARARWVLIFGAFAGLAFPDGATFLRPALPFFVAMVYALAMLRIDPVAVIRRLCTPRLAVIALAQVTALLVITPTLAFLIARGLGLGPEIEAALVYTFAAPPIASSAAMCLIIGFQAARALEITIVASLIMPVVGPIVAKTLIGAELSISATDLGMRMAAMIAGGFAFALIGRRIMGPVRIARNASALDGVAALAFLLFIMPLFDGVRDTILARPQLALGFLTLSILIVIGVTALALALDGPRDRNGAFGVVWGTRSVAIYLAALPPDPIFTLFVAIYQLPMAALALVFRRSAGK